MPIEMWIWSTPKWKCLSLKTCFKLLWNRDFQKLETKLEFQCQKLNSFELPSKGVRNTCIKEVWFLIIDLQFYIEQFWWNWKLYTEHIPKKDGDTFVMDLSEIWCGGFAPRPLHPANVDFFICGHIIFYFKAFNVICNQAFVRCFQEKASRSHWWINR